MKAKFHVISKVFFWIFQGDNHRERLKKDRERFTLSGWQRLGEVVTQSRFSLLFYEKMLENLLRNVLKGKELGCYHPLNLEKLRLRTTSLFLREGPG